MASTYTSTFNIEKIGSGEQAGAWGTTSNYNWDIVDRLASYKAIALSDASTATLTIGEASPGSGTTNTQDGMYRAIKFTGSLSQDCTITIGPNNRASWFIIENAAGDDIILSQGSGANVTVQNGKNVIVYCDGAGSGAAVVDALADLQIGTLEVTGVAAIDGALTQGGASQFNSTITVGVDDTGYDVKFFGDTASRYWLWDTSADGVVQRGALTVGVDDTGHDVKFFGATSGRYWLWDESADGVVQRGALTVGVDDTGHDVKFFGATSGAYLLWDESADDLKLVGAAGLTVAGDVDVDGTTNLDAVDIDGATQIDGTVAVGVDGTGYDVKFFGDTSGSYALWNREDDDLILAGAAGLSVAGGSALATLTTSGIVSVDDTTDSTSGTTGSIHTDGGLGVAKDVFFGGDITATNAAGPTVLNEAATATNPTFAPNKADPDTGVGWGTTNELSLITAGTEGMRIDANGAVTMPLQPAFCGYVSSSKANVTGNAVAYTVVYDGETIDQGADFATSTFTAPVAGSYLLTFRCTLGELTPTNTDGFIRIVTSNRNYDLYYNPGAMEASGAYGIGTIEMTVFADMDASDTATTLVTVNQGAQTVDVHGTSTTEFTTFSGYLVA